MEEACRIIVVEDDVALRFALSSWLDYEPRMEVVASVATGREALDALAAAAEAVDLLLVDYGLPDMSGADVVRSARTHVPALKVVMLTGHERDSLGGDLDGLGVDRFMLKGHAPTQLVSALLTVFDDDDAR